MSFSHPHILYFMWALPFLAFVQVVSARRRKKALESYADPHLLPRVAPSESRARVGIRNALVFLAMSLALFALAGPQWGERFQEVSQKGVDIVVCVDTSRSMLVTDVEPSRLEREKREVADLIKAVRGDRLGLVAFAGAAFLQCPLTLDYQALDMFLKQISPDLIPVQGTDLGAAIEAATAAFDPEANTDKVILLLTDGEDNESRGLEAAREAAEQGIKIFVFGIGDPSGGPVPAGAGGGFEKDGMGQLVLSKLEEDSLKQIARETGGAYVRSTDGDLDLDRLYFDGILRKTQAKEVKAGKITIREQRFYLFVLAAFLLLFVEGVLREKRLDATG